MKVETGIVLKAFRKHLSFTQQFVAVRLNVTLATLANIENGRACLDIEKLYLLSKIFGVPARILLDLTIEIYEKKSFEGLTHAVEQLKMLPLTDEEE